MRRWGDRVTGGQKIWSASACGRQGLQKKELITKLWALSFKLWALCLMIHTLYSSFTYSHDIVLGRRDGR